MKNLRITLIALIVAGFSQLSYSQVDVSINPLAAILAQNAKGAVEFGIKDDIGIEVNGVYNTRSSALGPTLGTGFTVGAIGKYYFNPDEARSNFYVGPYFRYIQYEPIDDLGSNLAVFKRGKAGIFGGYKIVSAKNIFFEFGLGVGTRVFNNFTDSIDLPGFDLTGKIALGYRFGNNSGTSTGNSTRNSKAEEMTEENEIDDRRKTTSRKKGKKKKKRGTKSRT